jgi:hypothetical protein
VTRCIGAGGAAWDPGGAEWRAAESAGLQRRFDPLQLEWVARSGGAPMSQGAYRRVCGAATPKGAAQRGCSATGPTPESNGFPVARLGDAATGPAQKSNGCPGCSAARYLADNYLYTTL